MEGSVLSPEVLTAKLYIGSFHFSCFHFVRLFLKIHIYTILSYPPTSTKCCVYLRCVWYNFVWIYQRSLAWGIPLSLLLLYIITLVTSGKRATQMIRLLIT